MYHLVPSTGETKPCRAKTPDACRFVIAGENTIHADSAEEVSRQYEAQMASSAVPSTSNNVSDVAQANEDGVVDSWYNRTEFTVLPENLDKAKKSIDQANKRLEKYGIDGRFEAEFIPYTVKRSQMVGGHKLEWEEEFIEMKLNAPSLSYAGYEFQATLTSVPESGGKFVTKNMPGVEMNGERPDKMVCEHCGHNRPRSKTFLIKGPDGKTHQIGSTCVQAYTGLNPKGLDMLRFDEESLMVEAKDSYGSRAARKDSSKLVVALAMAISKDGRSYESAQAGSSSTASKVRDALWGGKGVDVNWRESVLDEANKRIESGAVDGLLKKIQEDPGRNDYMANLKTYASAENVGSSAINMLASSVTQLKERGESEKPAWLVEKEEREKRMNFQPGHYLTPGAKIEKGTKFEVVDRAYTSRPAYMGDYEEEHTRVIHEGR